MDPSPTSCGRCKTPFDRGLDGLCPRCVALDMFAPVRKTTPLPGADSDEPRFFGNYEILSEIARGGMGVVYRARQPDLDRIVAVKTIAAGVLAGDEAIARFQLEAQAAASLSHPNIVTIHEVGQVQGQHYFVMEYVAGPTLAQRISDGPLPGRRAAAYLRAVAEAVEYAHGKGVLHRDLKPSNILLDENDQPRVTDFGLAKRLDSAQDVTLHGRVLGTPAFIAPEQAGGQSTTVGPQSDVYGLGAIMYQLITGRPPFTGESATEILAQVLAVEPVAPRLLHPACSRDLETVCLKCLEKDPARRYRSAGELAEDLERFLAGRPIRARPITPAERAWRWCKREPALAVAAGLITLLLIGIALVSTQGRRHIERLRLAGLTNLYAADMRLAQQAISESKFGAATALLERHRPAPGEPDLREFEWHHFMEVCRGEETAGLNAHPNQVQRVAFSPDGRLLATASTEIHVWEVATQRLLHRLPVGFFTWALGFSPDSRELAAGDNDGNLFRFDLTSQGRSLLLGQLTNPPARTLAFAWPSGSNPIQLITAHQLFAWDGTKSTPVPITNFPLGFARAQVSENGNRVAAVLGPRRVGVWKLNPPRPVREFDLGVTARAISISRDGAKAAAGDYSGTLHAWDLGEGGRTNAIAAHRGLIECVAFSPDGQRLASAGADQIVRVDELATGRLLTARQGHRATVMSLAFSPDGRWIASGDKEGQVKLWDLNSPPRTPARTEIPAATLSVDGARAAAFTLNSVVVRSSADLQSAGAATPVSPGWSPLVSANGLAFIDAEGRMRSLRPDGVWREHGEWRALPGGVLSSNGRFAALRLQNLDTPAVWDLLQDRPALLATNDHRWLSPTFSADSRRFAYGLPSGHVHIWALPSGAEVTYFQAHLNNYAYSCDLSPDGTKLATAGFDGLVKLWDIDHAQLLGEYRSSADAYWTVALSPDGRRIAAGTSESSIVLWDAASGQEVATFLLGEPLTPVEGLLRFAPDGSALLYHLNPRLRIWRAPKISL